MKKFIDKIENLLNESLNGFALAHNDIIEFNADPRYIKRKTLKQRGKVVLVSGGGSGHEPLHSGFVGKGMLDAACPWPNIYLTISRPDACCNPRRAARRWGFIHR